MTNVNTPDPTTGNPPEEKESRRKAMVKMAAPLVAGGGLGGLAGHLLSSRRRVAQQMPEQERKISLSDWQKGSAFDTTDPKLLAFAVNDSSDYDELRKQLGNFQQVEGLQGRELYILVNTSDMPDFSPEEYAELGRTFPTMSISRSGNDARFALRDTPPEETAQQVRSFWTNPVFVASTAGVVGGAGALGLTWIINRRDQVPQATPQKKESKEKVGFPGTHQLVFDPDNPKKTKDLSIACPSPAGYIAARTNYGGKTSKYAKETHQNEDSVLVVPETPDGSTAVFVLDGVGGGGKKGDGYHASKQVNDILAEVLSQGGRPVDALYRAGQEVTTGDVCLAGCKVDPNGTAEIWNIGDTKGLIIRETTNTIVKGASIYHETRDQSVVQALLEGESVDDLPLDQKRKEEIKEELKRLGVPEGTPLPPEKQYHFRFRNMVLGSIRRAPMGEGKKVQKDDVIVLASDGVFDVVSPYEISQLSLRHQDPVSLEKAVFDLAYDRSTTKTPFRIEYAAGQFTEPLSFSRSDNISVAVLKIGSSAPAKRPATFRLGAVGAGVVNAGRKLVQGALDIVPATKKKKQAAEDNKLFALEFSELPSDLSSLLSLLEKIEGDASLVLSAMRDKTFPHASKISKKEKKDAEEIYVRMSVLKDDVIKAKKIRESDDHMLFFLQLAKAGMTPDRSLALKETNRDIWISYAALLADIKPDELTAIAAQLMKQKETYIHAPLATNYEAIQKADFQKIEVALQQCNAHIANCVAYTDIPVSGMYIQNSKINTVPYTKTAHQFLYWLFQKIQEEPNKDLYKDLIIWAFGNSPAEPTLSYSSGEKETPGISLGTGHQVTTKIFDKLREVLPHFQRERKSYETFPKLDGELDQRAEKLGANSFMYASDNSFVDIQLIHGEVIQALDTFPEGAMKDLLLWIYTDGRGEPEAGISQAGKTGISLHIQGKSADDIRKDLETAVRLYRENTVAK